MSKNHLADPSATLFKERELQWRTVLPENSLVGVRLDGKAFHTFTRQFAKPYDIMFMDAMDKTGMFVLDNLITGALFGYVQSDEITLFFTDKSAPEAQLLYAGKVEKILSTSASTASVGFLRAMPEVNGLPVFDARVFLIESAEELARYLDWRRMDARKNAITMASEHVAGAKRLDAVPTRERLALLAGTEWETLPEGFLYGRLLTREVFEETVTWTHKRTGEVHTQPATRSRWVSAPAVREATAQVVADAATKFTVE